MFATRWYSSKVAVFIKTYEGFLLTSYDALPPKGDWTIGWGHKLIEYSGNKNNPNITWTQKKADEMNIFLYGNYDSTH